MPYKVLRESYFFKQFRKIIFLYIRVLLLFNFLEIFNYYYDLLQIQALKYSVNDIFIYIFINIHLLPKFLIILY
jgi:hypothetical protein